MSVIHTVTGPVDPARLGVTLVHEHLHLDLSGHKGDFDTRLTDSDAVLKDLAGLKAAGAGAVVELTNMGMGRNIAALTTLSRQSGLLIIAATGFYKAPFYPPVVCEGDAEALADLLVRELTAGIDNSGCCAGIIGEIGTGSGAITPLEEKVFRAAALAHRQTGAAISTHTTLGELGLEQVRLLCSLGVDPARIIVGHADLQPDPAYHRRLAQTGVYVAYDTVGKESYRPDAWRVEMICRMLDWGYAERLLLSCDITRLSHLTSRGGYGYQHLLRHFIPRLRAAGVDNDTITTVLVANPARVLPF